MNIEQAKQKTQISTKVYNGLINFTF